MAKRLTDTEKWKKKWIRDLSIQHKLLWVYLLDSCNHAGIIDWDIELFSFILGIEIDTFEVKNTFKDKIHFFKNDTKAFITGFIDFQYGELNPANKVHKSVMGLLLKQGLNLKGLSRGLQAPTIGAKDKDMDKDKDTDKDMDKDKEMKFMEKWNSMAEEHSLPIVHILNKERVNKIRTRLKADSKFEEHFNFALEAIGKSKFLQGNNKNGWRPNFDWLIENGNNYIKVCEGNYDDRKGKDKIEEILDEYKGK